MFEKTIDPGDIVWSRLMYGKKRAHFLIGQNACKSSAQQQGKRLDLEEWAEFSVKRSFSGGYASS